MKTQLPDDLLQMVTESDVIMERINVLRAKPRLTLSDLREIALLKMAIRRVCPPSRFAWMNGAPVCDILKTINKIEGEKNT